MKHAEVPTALLLTHNADERRTWRAALMAMNVLPEDIPITEGAAKSILDAFHQRQRTMAIINLDGLQAAPRDILAMERFFHDPELRKRILLTRHGTWHVWDADRKWVERLGFCGLLAEVSPASLTSEGGVHLHSIARQLDITPIAADKLAAYFSAMAVDGAQESPRGLIRATTGLTAENLASALASNAKAIQRTYKLKTYPACFVGSEAVSWLASHYEISREISVQLGEALQKLGLVHHVVHEQTFQDAQYFYRTSASTSADRLNPGNVFKLLRSGTVVEIRDRMYRGKTYPDCFVGTEAVDWLCTYYLMKRHDAEIFLNRLRGFGLIAHVTDDHLVRDDYFFYRLMA